MNFDKTTIIQLHNEIEPEWVANLRFHSIHEYSEKDLISYFSKTFIYIINNPNENVAKYAIKKAKSFTISVSNWSIFESLILKLALSNTIVIPDVLDILVNYKNKGYKIDTFAIEKTMNFIIRINCEYNYAYEIIWAIWVIDVLDLKLHNLTIKAINNVDDALVALTMLYMINNNKVISQDNQLWKNHMKGEELYSNYWMLAYEGYKRGWLPSKSGKDYIKSKLFFEELRNSDISFLRERDEAHEKYIAVFDIFDDISSDDEQNIDDCETDMGLDWGIY